MPVDPILIRPDRPAPRSLFRAYEAIAPRVPRPILRLIGRLMLRLPRGSRARRWFVLTISNIGWNATVRSRFDLVMPIWDPTCEWRWDPNFMALGFDEVYSGHDGVKRSLAQWNEIWTDRSFTIREILDGGNTWVMRMTLSGRGAASGVPTQGDGSSVIRLDPLIVYWHNFADDAQALREAGFPRSSGEVASGDS